MIRRKEASRAELRLRFFGCVAVILTAFGILALRLAYLQVVQGARYRYLSENNRIRLERVAGPRGMILDRNGEILADVAASFVATVIPRELARDRRAAVYQRLATVLAMEPAAVQEVVEGPGPASWKPRILKRRLSREEMARLEVHRLELPGVVVQASSVRSYPHATLAGGVLGYVGEISGAELQAPAFAEYEAGDVIGRAGLESAWEGVLHGQAGGQQVEVDVRGRKLNVLAEQPARAGRNLTLTLDLNLQRVAEQALAEHRAGAVAVLEVATGDVLALASVPTYDPNQLARGLTAEAWSALASDPLHPLQGRALQGVYPPGSTFKIPMALAGLAEGVITPRTEVFCGGALPFAGREYRCWKKTGHGSISLEQALAQSCDVYFYQLGLDLGVDTIHRYATALGLGRPTGIDVQGEAAGLVPSKAWKRRARGEPWYPGETLSVAIGQGYLLTTPLQLAAMTAAVAHPQGALMWPRLVARIEGGARAPAEEIPPRQVGTVPVRDIHLVRVRAALREVVAGQRGTGSRAEVEGLPVAGKTGTAQVVAMPDDEEWDAATVAWRHQDHALFVCFAPWGDPKVAVAVVVEHGGHGGSTAAPVAHRVLAAYRDLGLEVSSLGAAP